MNSLQRKKKVSSLENSQKNVVRIRENILGRFIFSESNIFENWNI